MLRRTTVRPVGRLRDRYKSRRTKPTDNNPDMTRGAVEWLPRPVRLTYSHVNELQEWSMRQQLDGDYTEINHMRNVQREWGQHPPRPMLGDAEPSLPKGIWKDNHIARTRFLIRWHRANSPNHWMWLPKTGAAPERRQHASDYSENWKVLRDADQQRSR